MALSQSDGTRPCPKPRESQSTGKSLESETAELRTGAVTKVGMQCAGTENRMHDDRSIRSNLNLEPISEILG